MLDAAVLIAERFLLLALDPAAGTVHAPRPDTNVARLCAAGLLLELISQHRVQVQDRGISLESLLPPNHPLLQASCRALPASGQLDTGVAISQIERRLRPLQRELLDGLFRRDFLHRVRDWRFWDADSTRYPLRSIQARNEAIANLNHAALATTTDLAGLGLLLLADIAGLMTEHLDAAHHERASATLLALNHVPPGDTERYSYAAVRTALLA